jgi:hypothetical protein
MNLLPCPFCGNDAELFDQPDAQRNIVACRLGHAPMRTVEGWNTRHEEQRLRELLDQIGREHNEMFKQIP